MSRLLIASIFAALLLATTPTRAAESAKPMAGPDLFAQLKALPDPLARYLLLQRVMQSEDLQQRQMAMQLMAFQAAELGNYRQAEASYQQDAERQARNGQMPGALATEDAAASVLRLAKDRRIVMINEAHHVARTRLLTLSLLEPLRKAGFTHLALETLDDDDTGLAQRGYAVDSSGYYTKEPVFATLVREALQQGYILVPYEYTGNTRDHQARETGQATNLVRVLREHPDARMLVHAGYAHIYRNDPQSLFGTRTMVEELERLGGGHALTVEQTLLFDHPDADKDHPAYAAGVARWQATHAGALPTRPFVLLADGRTPWSLRPQVFDVSVFSAPRNAGQTWLSLGGRRQSYSIPADSCGGRFPCLIEARRKGETDEAIPADRRLLDATGPVSLWLAQGCYRLSALTMEAHSTPIDYCTPDSLNAPAATEATAFPEAMP